MIASPTSWAPKFLPADGQSHPVEITFTSDGAPEGIVAYVLGTGPVYELAGDPVSLPTTNEKFTVNVVAPTSPEEWDVRVCVTAVGSGSQVCKLEARHSGSSPPRRTRRKGRAGPSTARR